MKFIDIPQLEELNNVLSFDTPESKIAGGVDVFTTKPAGSDKKLYKVLDKQLTAHQVNMLNQYEHWQQHPEPVISNGEYLSSSASPPTAVAVLSPPTQDVAAFGGRAKHNEHQRRLSNTLSTSPFGPLEQRASRKTFAYLISVLNASQPDHDFSSLMPEDFKREPSSAKVINTFNNTLFGLGMPVPPKLWECLDSEIDLKDCTIYSHSPPQTFLDDEPGTMWSVMWFFFNKKKKRVAHLYLKAVRHHASPVLSHAQISVKNKSRGQIQDDFEEDYDLTYSSDTNSLYDEEVVGGMEMD